MFDAGWVFRLYSENYYIPLVCVFSIGRVILYVQRKVDFSVLCQNLLLPYCLYAQIMWLICLYTKIIISLSIVCLVQGGCFVFYDKNNHIPLVCMFSVGWMLRPYTKITTSLSFVCLAKAECFVFMQKYYIQNYYIPLICMFSAGTILRFCGKNYYTILCMFTVGQRYRFLYHKLLHPSRLYVQCREGVSFLCQKLYIPLVSLKIVHPSARGCLCLNQK